MADRFTGIWRDWRGFMLFIAVMLVFRSAIADWNQVPTKSMLPTILAGDRIVVDKLAYDLRLPFTLTRLARWEEPARGDVVTFNSPQNEQLLVKRIVGVPGDIVALEDNVLVINGERASYQALPGEALPRNGIDRRRDYRYLSESILGHERMIMLHPESLAGSRASFGPVEVPAGAYLMLGDNRDISEDSRYIGFVARENILGRANAVAFSLDYDNYYRPRSERFFAPLAEQQHNAPEPLAEP